MTAEIAILNKTAVALAADSAVTISAGSSQEKIYDSAEKLFELSCHDPIGVMINNDMNFMEAPLPVLIKGYRSGCPTFKKVSEAASDFLRFLHSFGQDAPERVKLLHLQMQIAPLVELIQKRAHEALMSRVFGADSVMPDKPISEVVADFVSEQIGVIRQALERTDDAEFVGDGPLELSQPERAAIVEVVTEKLELGEARHKDEVVELLIANIHKRGISASSTGVIVAGFGSDELFPTLEAFELYGMVGNRLKFVRGDSVDIDRNGDRARVIPFAQREMVERFLYGLDAGIERKITSFCKSSVPGIREKILESLEMSEEDREALIANAEEAEQGFFTGLAERSFEAIRKQSQTEIEDMVEFMPKSEMAKMAEALVNLTSIKRRVSRGMETVGGPIDVAVISQADGFVWVRRKHYFPPELNNRYFERMRRQNSKRRETDDA